MSRGRDHASADAMLVRRTAVRVGVWMTVAVSALVVIVLCAAFAFVYTQVPLGSLLDPESHPDPVDISAQDIVLGGILLGLLTVALAGALAVLATRRAVAPLVDAMARQRRFVADASHELRTPLAVFDARLQLLERDLASDDPHGALVAELRGDSLNVIAVVNDLLDSIDLTSEGDADPQPLGPLVEGAVASMRVLAAERGVSIESARAGADVSVAMPPASVYRSVVALLDNAVKHSPRGATVEVLVGAERGAATIAVTDRGGGIRGIDPERIFDRFARSSDAVDGGGSSATGFGIGLSLVHDTVGRFGGSVEVTRTSPAGTTITVRLPRPRR